MLDNSLSKVVSKTIPFLRHERKLINIDESSLEFQFLVPSISLEQFKNFLFVQLILQTVASLLGPYEFQVKCC